MIGFFKVIRESFVKIRENKCFNLIVLAAIVLSIPLTLTLSQRKQNTHSSAASSQQYIIYDDSLSPGWLEWSDADVDPDESEPVYSGSRAISYRSKGPNAKLYFHTENAIDTTPYAYLHFAAKASKPGQRYSVALEGINDDTLNAPLPLANVGGDPTPFEWKVYDIPLTQLAANNTTVKGFILKGITGTSQPKLFVDEIDLRLGNVPPPPTVAPKLTPAPTLPPPPFSTPTPKPTAIPTPTPTPKQAVTTVPTPTPIVTNGNWWKPTADRPIQIHWQLSTDFNPTTDFVPQATVYDFDGEHATKATVDAVHNRGFIAICYIDVGVYETYRSDASRFPQSVIGSKDVGWGGSFWLDIRRVDIIGPIMKDRIQMCKDKGFDAVEPDEENGFDNNSGFPLTYNDQLVYNKWIADTVHAMGMSVGLKSDQAQAKDLVNWHDWNLTEECYQYNECDQLAPFKAANKATFIVEYAANPNCTHANSNHYNAIKRDRNLVGPKDSGYSRTSCMPDGSTQWP